MRKAIIMFFFIISVMLLVGGCEQGRTSGKGLYLPPGDVVKGRLAFIDLGCMKCHTIKGLSLPTYVGETPLAIELGGEVYIVKTYGELLTSIINPDHVISPKYLRTLSKTEKADKVDSPMPSFNEKITVAQLIDLITFLDSQYTEHQPDYQGYRYGFGP